MKKTAALIIAVLMLISLLPLSAAAADIDSSKTAQEMAEYLTGAIAVTDVSMRGNVKYFSNAESFGFDKGIILDTGDRNLSTATDPDIAKLMDYVYGGDTSVLQFTMKADGEVLNFEYAFASCEFDQEAKFNDVFGLFVKVNDGEFENIANLSNGKPVTITNLRAGEDGTQLNNGTSTSIETDGHKYDYFTGGIYPEYGGDNVINGVTDVFTAVKYVNKGDTVTLKFVIADVTDTLYNSYVMIKEGSVRFYLDGVADYEKAAIIGLNPGKTVEITLDDGTVYSVIVNEDGEMPFAGTDKNGNVYNLYGKKFTIVEKADGPGRYDSIPQEFELERRELHAEWEKGSDYVGGLTPNRLLEIASDGKTYTVPTDASGSFPVSGTDENGNDYDFFHKSLSITEKGASDTELDSLPQEVKIGDKTPKPAADYENKTVTGMNYNKKVEITDENGKVITVVTDETGTFPIEGKDINGESYSLYGQKLTIVEKADEFSETDSAPLQLTIIGEELPTNPPVNPPTGDGFMPYLFGAAVLTSAVFAFAAVKRRRKLDL